jgi:hypothetical protein
MTIETPERTEPSLGRRWAGIVLASAMLIASAYLMIVGIFSQVCFDTCPPSSGLGPALLIAGLVVLGAVPFVLALVTRQPRWFARGAVGLAILVVLLFGDVLIRFGPSPILGIGLMGAVALRAPDIRTLRARVLTVGIVAVGVAILVGVRHADALDGAYWIAAFWMLPALGVADWLASATGSRRPR